MKKYIYPMALTATLLATAACSDDEVNDIQQVPDSQKEMISFSLSDAQGAVTRAMTRAGFASETTILMHIESKKNGQDSWRNTRTTAVAAAHSNHENKWSDVSFTTDATKRYWDDCYGRNGELSIYAVAIPGKSNLTSGDGVKDGNLNESDLTETTGGVGNWTADVTSKPAHTIQWGVTTSGQTSTVRDNEDLVYSNNIQIGGTKGVYRFNFTSQTAGSWPTMTEDLANLTDGVMKFSQLSGAPADAPGKFDKGHMIFNHALTRVTITLEEGEGFNSGSTDDFKFTGAKQITLHKMNTNGTLNIQNGTWSDKVSNVDATLTTTAANANTTFYGQFLPDNVFTKGAADAANNVISFTIDNNTYYVTEADLYTALYNNVTDAGARTEAGITDAKVTLKQGKNYIFNITVKKKDIQAVTATVVEWDKVTAENFNKNNTHYSFTFHETGNAKESYSTHHLFRKGEVLDKIYTGENYTATTYQGAYTDKATLSDENSDGIWSTNWFYDDNKTAYHFRVINDKSYTSSSAGDNYTSSANAKFNMVNGAQSTQDYHWGAPLDPSKVGGNSTDGYKYAYSTDNGYQGLLMQGIMSTESQINLTEFHMMSNINIVVRTTNQSNKVSLVDGSNKTKVFITKVYTGATVDMGIGKVTTTGSRNSDTAIETGEGANIITTPDYSGLTADGKVTIDGTEYDAMKTPAYTWSVVPQALVEGDTKVGLIIQTPDENKYYVVEDLASIVATSVGTSANQTTSAINYWYPNHSYTYTITITKKGIEAITCTLADWVNVTGTNTNITLEN